MAEITKRSTASLASLTPGQDKTLVGHVAGEAIAAWDACYIKSDGKVWRSTGAAATAPAKVRGWAMSAAAVNEPVTLVSDVSVGEYASGLTPGADLFLSGTVPGGLADAASTGGTAPVAFARSATKIHVFQSRY